MLLGVDQGMQNMLNDVNRDEQLDRMLAANADEPDDASDDDLDEDEDAEDEDSDDADLDEDDEDDEDDDDEDVTDEADT